MWHYYRMYLGALCLLTSCQTVETMGDISASRQNIAFYESGAKTGTPVVFQAGLGDGKDVWTQVLAGLPSNTHVFAYDRPGYGDSAARQGSRDPCTIAREQHELLRQAGLQPPYVMVGHSLGGLYTYVYARLYPDDVKALLLLDPTHPQHQQRLKQETDVAASALSVVELFFTGAMKQEYKDQTSCLETLDQTSCLETLDQTTAFNIPTTILIKSEFEAIEQGGFKTVARSLAKDWQRMTNASQLSIVDNSGHYIQKDQPQRVIQEIESFLP